jgi:hypothetical protein
VKPWDDHPQPRAGLCYPARVHPSKIGLLVSLVEAYDGLAVVRTKDAAAGIVEFWISPLMQQDFESFLEAAREELGLVAGDPVIPDVNAPGFPDAPSS